MKHLLRICLLLLVLCVCPVVTYGFPSDIEFYSLRTSDGLSNTQINDIHQDTQGYIWFATQSGLNRFDGFRFKVFYFDNHDKKSLPNNCVNEIQEDSEGHLWVHTSLGYSIYDPMTETFDADVEAFLQPLGVQGDVEKVMVDDHKNLWVAIEGRGIYFVDMKQKHARFVEYSKAHSGLMVTSIAKRGNHVVATYNNGLVIALDARTLHPKWSSTFLGRYHESLYEGYTAFVDKHYNYWIAANNQTSVYCTKESKWYLSANDFLTRHGYQLPFKNVLLLKDLEEDNSNGLWLATDHLGLLRMDYATREVRQYTNNRDVPTSVANNTIESLLIDTSGALWIGCYKNGVSYYSPSQSKFHTIPIGDVCTIAEDRLSVLWCGTNDKGIVAYNPKTGSRRTYDMAETSLGSNVVVSSVATHDGSLWFGTYNGGMVHYDRGQWTVYRADGKSGLLNDNVWSLCELPDGRIAIGTLGGGVQLLNPRTGRFVNYTLEKNGLSSNYINSVVVGSDGRLIVGHSVNYSVIDLRTGKVENVTSSRSGQSFLSTQVNQIYEDSRGIVWMATASGINAYDPKTDQLHTLDWQAEMTGSVACSVMEDHDHNMWLVSDHGVSRVLVKRNNGLWDFFTISYNSLDGLQARQFNYRSIVLTRDGSVVVGGQDGLNVIPPQKISHDSSKARVIFSGLILFDHPLGVGEEYDGHVVLRKSMDGERMLHLKHSENAFTIQLASSEVSIPEKSRFMYRLRGFSDKWFSTTEGQSNVTFTSMPPGKYTLEARVITRYGVISGVVSKLDIVIAPPFYLSVWAILLYIFIVTVAVWYARRVFLRRQQTKFEMQQMHLEAERTREVNEMKLTFFTNVSHELRTPLTLIISPLASMLRRETDPEKKKNLELIYRNAVQLHDMVTQVLDFRKMDKQKETLNLSTGNIVEYVRNMTNTMRALGGKDVDVSFVSPFDSLLMRFDADKVHKMVSNLLSNAMKFTPDGGSIVVSLQRVEDEESEGGRENLLIKVADTGIGIADEDKAHVFERFYQAKDRGKVSYGGTGVGLNLVQMLARLHGGDVGVADNPSGGTVFTIVLPITHGPGLGQKADETVEMPTCSVEADDTLSPEDRTEQPDKAQQMKQPEVLIVDDSRDFLEFMTAELGTRFKVRVAANGKEALDRISDHKPDIILSDVMMPVMDGNELCRRVKSNKEMAGIPFIMLTARMAQEHQVEGMEMGADDYITKPFNIDLLYLRMENLIKWHRMTPDEKQGKIQPELKPMVVTSLDEQLVKRATAYVDDNITDSTITVEGMAAHLGMSRVQLYKKLLSITGVTPSEFMRQIRMRRGEQLLRESQYTVSEVAYKVGFNVPRYFTKYFKEMYGVTPSQYKNQSENKE